jgi:acetolactate synthase-1/2/3 large subunit
MVIDHPDQLKPALDELIKAKEPVVLDIKVVKDANCYPMVPAGASNAQMIGLPRPIPLDFDRIELIFCPNCGAKNPSTNNFCPSCGGKI